MLFNYKLLTYNYLIHHSRSVHINPVCRFGRKLVTTDLYRLPEVVAVREQGGGRMVCLLPSSLARHSPLGSSQSHDGSSTNGSPVVFEELEYHEPVCKRHYTQQDFRYTCAA